MRSRSLLRSGRAHTNRARQHDRPVRRIPGPGCLPAEAQGALRHRRIAVRRPRCSDQHHAAHPAGHGRRGDPPGAQPLGRRSRHRGAAGGRAGHCHQQLPGRARRVLQVHDRSAQGTRRRAHQGLRRRRRRHRAGRDRRAPGRRRGAHLQPRRRPAHGAERHDRRDADDERPGPVALRAEDAGSTSGPGQPPRPGTADHGAGERPRRRQAQGRAAGRRGEVQDPGAGHHRYRRRRQEQPHRRTDPPAAARPARCAADRRHQHRPQPPQERRRAARRPHPHERHRPVACGHGRGRRRARVHAQPGHARLRQRDQPGPARRAVPPARRPAST